MRHNDYKRTLFEEKSERFTLNMITSSNQTITTCNIMKVRLSPYDDKRFVMNDKIKTSTHGHYEISLLKDNNDIFAISIELFDYCITNLHLNKLYFCIM